MWSELSAGHKKELGQIENDKSWILLVHTFQPNAFKHLWFAFIATCRENTEKLHITVIHCKRFTLVIIL